jgi:transposase
MPKKTYIVELTTEERGELEALTRKGRAAARKIRHAQILLQTDAKGPNRRDEAVAGLLGCHRNTVGEVRQRFVEEGMEAALERKRRDSPPVEPKMDGREEARLIALTRSQAPEGHARWSLRLLADRFVTLEEETVSYETVRRVLKKTSSSRICASAG